MELSRRNYLQMLGTGTAASIAGCNQLPTGDNSAPYEAYTPVPNENIHTRDQHSYYRPKEILSTAEATGAPALKSYKNTLNTPVRVPTGLLGATSVDAQTWGDVDWYLTDTVPRFRVFSNDNVVVETRNVIEDSDWVAEDSYNDFDFWSLKHDVFAINESVAIYVNGNYFLESGRPTAEAIVDAKHGKSRFSKVNKRYRELCGALGDGMIVNTPGAFRNPVDAPGLEYADGLIGIGLAVSISDDTATVTRAVAYDSVEDVSVEGMETHVTEPKNTRAKEMYSLYESVEVSQSGRVVVFEGKLPAPELSSTAILQTI